jgi:hypothetical protein
MHDNLIGPFSSSENSVTRRSYFDMLELYALPQLPPQTILQQDGASPHFCRHVRNHLDREMAGRWIGKGLQHIHYSALSTNNCSTSSVFTFCSVFTSALLGSSLQQWGFFLLFPCSPFPVLHDFSCPGRAVHGNNLVLDSPVESFLGSGPFRTRDNISVTFKIIYLFWNGASSSTTGGVGLSATTPSRVKICCWPSPARLFGPYLWSDLV